MSEYIKTEKGLFQGNPIAPYLFILVMERLAIALRDNKNIKGIKIKDKELLVALFADDLGLLLEHDQQSWNAVEQTFNQFENETGMKINYDKTVLYRLGSLRNTNAKFYSRNTMTWTDKPFKVLGIKLADSIQDLREQNYTSMIPYVEAVLQMWIYRGLSLFGKILVVNSLIGSLFTYKFTVLPMPSKEFFKQINKIIKDFVWDGKKVEN